MLCVCSVTWAIVLHFLFDWVLQSRHVAETKAVKPRSLLIHAVEVWWGTVFTLAGAAYMEFGHALNVKAAVPILLWGTLYTIVHAAQDWTIYQPAIRKHLRRFGGRRLTDCQYGELMRTKAPWNTIALDQALHLTVLFWVLDRFLLRLGELLW